MLCGEELEDVIHVLALCPFARLVWVVSSVPWDIVAPTTGDVESWFRRIRSRGTWQDFEMAAMTSWALWYNRNKKVFEGAGMMAHGVVELGRRQTVLRGDSVTFDLCLVCPRMRTCFGFSFLPFSLF
ncbi:hypothetical protein Salat_2689700 [Sesamum alatum]|uniref:Reverse transcriptase zinc-binding domain-containing protein n=1 Tax=Sesamum alatum TaxID=300844 RepID=A0AAE1XPT6_9LAMI|nr:hypothetical protein Salat_2689700 [Sesamum alatum]